MTICVAACNDAKSPDKDVAKAEQKASSEVAKSEDSAAKDLNVAAAKVDDKPAAPKADDPLDGFKNIEAKNAYDLAIGNADGDYKIALANCEQSTGDQKQCKDQVEADYSAAKAKAEAAAQSQRR
jgi:hypothetical protein